MTHPVSARPAGGKIFTVSSDSEEVEEEVFIPLAVRLKQKAVAKSTCESQKSCVSQNGGLKMNISAAQGVTVVEEDPCAARSYAKEDEVAGLRKRKRTLEEIEASREEALRRKAEREKQHGERLRVEKKALTDAVKAMRPDECIKHMVVVVDPGRWRCCSSIFLKNSVCISIG